MAFGSMAPSMPKAPKPKKPKKFKVPSMAYRGVSQQHIGGPYQDPAAPMAAPASPTSGGDEGDA